MKQHAEAAISCGSSCKMMATLVATPTLKPVMYDAATSTPSMYENVRDASFVSDGVSSYRGFTVFGFEHVECAEH